MREVVAAYADISDHASWVASSDGIGTVWKWSYTHSESHAVPSAYAASSRITGQCFSVGMSIRSSRQP
jgi:hypothetical protein